MTKITKEEALKYHEGKRPGKIEVVPTKPYFTQMDLSLAYSPGVAEPCLEIQKDQENAYKYTDKGNLVAVISNGTAVLGLGDIGALSGKPVMEGKGLLFKIYAGIDVFEMEPPVPADHPLMHSKHTVVTPHVAFASHEALFTRAQIVSENILKWEDGTPQNVIC